MDNRLIDVAFPLVQTSMIVLAGESGLRADAMRHLDALSLHRDVEKAGVQLSLQAISALINNKPSALRLQRIQALCKALEYDLRDFFNVTPDTVSEKKKARRVAGDAPVRLYAGKIRIPSEVSIFPDPHTYAKAARADKPEDENNV